MILVKNEMSSRVVELLKDWEDENVVYCHWKSIDHIYESYCGVTDLDILVDPNNAVTAEYLLGSKGFVQMNTSSSRAYPGVKDFIYYDDKIDKFMHIHLHYQLVLGDRWMKCYRTPVERGLLLRRVWLKKYETWIVSPEDELVLLIARMTVKFSHPFRSKKILKEIGDIKERVGNLNSVLAEYPESFINASSNVLKNILLDVDIKKVRSDMQTYRRMNILIFKIVSTFRYLFRVYVEVNRRFIKNFSFGRRRFYNPGISIAFVGMDGSGKTSAIQRNIDYFAKQMDVKGVFLGSGQSGAPWYRKLAFIMFGTRAKFSGHKRANTEKKYPLYYLLWAYSLLYEKNNRMKKIFKSKSNGMLVFADRWPQDSVDNTLDGCKFHNVNSTSLLVNYIKKFEERMILRSKRLYPDIVIKFNIDPEVSLERKVDELSIDEARQASVDLQKIKWNEFSRVVDIDANKNIEQVDILIREAIWSAISNSLGASRHE